jgi:hypothetical protein
MRKIPIIISLLLCAQLAFAAEYAVRPPASCPNNGNGASWACAATAGGVGAKSSTAALITLLVGVMHLLVLEVTSTRGQIGLL